MPRSCRGVPVAGGEGGLEGQPGGEAFSSAQPESPGQALTGFKPAGRGSSLLFCGPVPAFRGAWVAPGTCKPCQERCESCDLTWGASEDRGVPAARGRESRAVRVPAARGLPRCPLLKQVCWLFLLATGASSTLTAACWSALPPVPCACNGAALREERGESEQDQSRYLQETRAAGGLQNVQN